MSKGKPLVVLAGWLGCQKRSLRRYENLFSEQGYQVMSRIASPTIVVESCFQKVPPPALLCPNGWPNEDMQVQGTSSMQNFAWDVLREVHKRECDHFIFYAFSNGGCFVWEQVRKILNLSEASQQSSEQILDKEQHQVIRTINEKTAGVIFDSCPSRQLADVGRALAFCSLGDRMEVMMSHGMDIAFFPSTLSQEKRDQSNVRSTAYYNTLMNDPSTTPQLYLYSDSDILIPGQVVDELVHHRRDLIGKDRVFRRKWNSSRHCAHFIDNPEEYTVAVGSFLEACYPKSKPISKL